MTCYICHKAGHKASDCLLRFNIRELILEELQMEVMAQMDIAWIDNVVLETEEAALENADFVWNNEWKACPCCLAITVRGRSTSSLRGTVLRSSYLDLILSHAPISLIIPVYLRMILSLFHRVLRCSIRSFVILIATIVTGRLWRPSRYKGSGWWLWVSSLLINFGLWASLSDLSLSVTHLELR